MATAAVADQWAQYELSHVCFIAFAWPIVPAVGLGYSGYSTRKSGLASFLPAILSIAGVTVQWWAVGYSLAYSEGNGFIGDLSNIFHKGVLAEPVGAIPALLFSQFQLVFCATVCAISVGGFCERGRLLPILPFIILWATFVYCPLAHMVWGGGILEEFGALDYAGGTPVHICSGASATAISVYLSWPQFRSKKSATRTPQHLKLHRPHNSMSQLIALILIWGGWLAFDAGTTLELNFKSIMTMYTTNLGLVLITPSAGFIDVTTSFFFGIFGALVCRQALRFKSSKLAARLRWVDNGDTFATHCVGGFAGTLMTGLFAKKEVAAYDGATEIVGGVVFDGNYAQVGIQAVEALVGFTWAFVGSYIIIALLDCIPGLEVLATDKEVIDGMDASQMDESLYEAQWAGESEYHPFGKGVIEI
ncbi:putative ammonium transporter [Pseudohyphozyma bogoriensis]|nr:putative ammonium transporter [Pseudohyphozyma bogoriensis]